MSSNGLAAAMFFHSYYKSSNLSNSLLNLSLLQSIVHLTVLTVACSLLEQPSYVISKTLGAFVVAYYLFRTNDSQTPWYQKTWGEVMHICM